MKRVLEVLQFCEQFTSAWKHANLLRLGLKRVDVVLSAFLDLLNVDVLPKHQRPVLSGRLIRAENMFKPNINHELLLYQLTNLLVDIQIVDRLQLVQFATNGFEVRIRGDWKAK